MPTHVKALDEQIMKGAFGKFKELDFSGQNFFLKVEFIFESSNGMLHGSHIILKHLTDLTLKLNIEISDYLNRMQFKSSCP